MVGLILKVDDSEIQEYLTQLQSKVQNLEPAYKIIGEYMILAIIDRYDKEITAEGQPWAALSAATIKQKQRKGKIQKILQQDGDLRRTIIYQTSPTQLEIGTNRIYAAIHQFGGQAGRGKKVTIQARPFLGISEADKSEIVKICQDFLIT
jgi:phage virion morphogenesis protein